MEEKLYQMLRQVLDTLDQYEECKSFEWWTTSKEAYKLVKNYEKKKK